jgi:hypothetical protein
MSIDSLNLSKSTHHPIQAFLQNVPRMCNDHSKPARFLTCVCSARSHVHPFQPQARQQYFVCKIGVFDYSPEVNPHEKRRIRVRIRDPVGFTELRHKLIALR